jgi:putative membrane protein
MIALNHVSRTPRLATALAIACLWLGVTETARAQRTMTLDDAAILALFDEANSADIWTARLGIQRARSEDVKTLARGVAADHEAVQQMGREVARKIGIVPALPASDTSMMDHAKALAALGAQSADAFDRAYVKHEVAYHAGVIQALKGTLIPSAKNPELKALLEKVLPGFEHHLEATRAVAAKIHAD